MNKRAHPTSHTAYLGLKRDSAGARGGVIMCQARTAVMFMLWMSIRPIVSQITATYQVVDMPIGVTETTIQQGFSTQPVTSVTLTQIGDSRVSTDTCPAGSYSTADASTCTLCPAGKYSSITSAISVNDCISCDAGTYSGVLGAISVGTCTACTNGKYSTTVGGTVETVCQSCPQNSNSGVGAQSLSSCVCNPGYVGPNGGPCAACAAGVWCLNGKQNQCPLHSTSPALSSLLSQCLCNPGYYGDASLPTPDSATVCQLCKENHFCPGGAVNYTEMCKDGKYSLPGADDVGDCNCPDNAVSRQMSSQAKECVCDSGFYKVYTPQAALGGWRCEVCKPGEFCYDNANKTCPPFSVSSGVAKSVMDCYCKPGFANASMQTELELCVDCPANYYCAGKGVITRCVTNAVSPVQSPDSTRCFCDWGWKGVNNDACVACASPTYCYTGLQAQCSEGTYSEPLSWDRTNCSCIPGRWGPRGGPCIKCAAGKYNLLPGCVACTNQTDTDCVKCEVGTASSVEGRNTTCDACPNGTFSGSVAGATACTKCPNGTYSLGRAGTCTKCPLGWWALEGAVKCTPCPRDTYLNLEGQGDASACIACPEGTVSARLGNPDPACSACPPGTYQLNGVCTACPAGSYSKSASVSCKPCLSGTFSTGNATTCTDCDVGSYTGGNYSSECAFCGAGSYAEFTGMTACVPCKVGFFVEYDGAQACTQCNLGEYAAQGATSVRFSCFFTKNRVFSQFDPKKRLAVHTMPSRELVSADYRGRNQLFRLRCGKILDFVWRYQCRRMQFLCGRDVFDGCSRQ